METLDPNRKIAKPRIAVLADIEDFRPSYSLSHCILDQLTMLCRYGYEPVLFCNLPAKYTVTLPGGYHCGTKRLFPNPVWLRDALVGFSHIFTHDWIHHERFQHWAHMLEVITAETRDKRFFHWVHSVPTIRREWWDMRRYGSNHRLVYENHTDAHVVAQQFRCHDVVVIPPIVDPRILFDFPLELWKLVDELPGLMTADFVQIYPAAADRFTSKGVDKLIKTFSQLKVQGSSVCCLVVDSWSERIKREPLEPYRDLAKRLGLNEKELAFASEVIEGFTGFKRTDLMKLQLLSNVFVNPTMGEAFGLSMPEAVLAGAYPVPNGSLPMLKESVGGYGYYPKFGSCEERFQGSEKEFYRTTGVEIDDRIHGQTAHLSRPKRHARLNFNMDTVFKRYYQPILEEPDDYRHAVFDTLAKKVSSDLDKLMPPNFERFRKALSDHYMLEALQ